MVERVTDYIKSLNYGYKIELVDQKVKYFNKLAKLIGPNKIEVFFLEILIKIYYSIIQQK